MRAAAENDSLISMRDLDITDGITEIETRAHFELQVTIGYGATADGMANRDRGLRTAGCLLFRAIFGGRAAERRPAGFAAGAVATLFVPGEAGPSEGDLCQRPLRGDRPIEWISLTASFERGKS
jgi:hypothetical protein